MDWLVKGIITVMYKIALFYTEVSALRKANKELNKRQRVKKTHTA